MKAAGFTIGLVLMLVSASTGFSAEEGAIWTLWPPALAIGQVGILSVCDVPDTMVSGTFLGRPVYFHRRPGGLTALVPVDLYSSPGIHPLSIEYRQIDKEVRKRITVDVEVHKWAFPVERVELPEKMVTFPEEILERIKSEKRLIDAVFEKTGRSRPWNQEFILPLKGDIVGSFGSRRILNGEERSPHSGVDVRAKEGTPVICANKGLVALVGNFYLTGNTVIIDHGQGTYSYYCHLSRVLVRERELLDRGQILGEVGSTGRATGPHLHWGIRCSGARVDPASFIAATAAIAKAGR